MNDPNPLKSKTVKSTNRHGPIDILGVITFLVILAATVALFYFSSINARLPNPGKIQHTWVDKNGHLHVLGIELGKTTLRQAENLLKSRSDVALYMVPDTVSGNNLNKLSLEAFFPSIADHSKVILGLSVSDNRLRQLKTDATLPRMYPNGIARMNINPHAIVDAQNYIVNWLRLVPSTDLDYFMLTARFGEADETTISLGREIYKYQQLGLVAELNDPGKDILTFRSPPTAPP